MKITDFHTHAFPDALAARAISMLTADTLNVTAWLNGRLSSLLASMDMAGIDRAVICSIATKPEQFSKIMTWSRQIQSERVVPLISFHPRDPDPCARVREVAAAGFRGIKLHPYYQEFHIDEDAMLPVYTEIARLGLLLVCHTGFDAAFPRVRLADPLRITRVLDLVPNLKLITTHLGGWDDWDAVERHLIGRPVYMETSYSLEMLDKERARQMLTQHPRDYLLFGSDSPWQDQSQALARLRDLSMGTEWEEAVLAGNAARLLE